MSAARQCFKQCFKHSFKHSFKQLRVERMWMLFGLLAPPILVFLVSITVSNCKPIVVALPALIRANPKILCVHHKLIISSAWVLQLMLFNTRRWMVSVVLPIFCAGLLSKASMWLWLGLILVHRRRPESAHQESKATKAS